MLTSMNIQAMMNHGVRKIVAFCPHCFNALAVKDVLEIVAERIETRTAAQA